METKKKLMHSAFRLFADKGTEFSLTEVACEVGIQKASIYAHFASKEELLYAVINQEINQYFLEINAQCRDLESMYHMILNYYEQSQTKLYFWKRLLLFPPKVFEETLVTKIQVLSDERFELVKDILRTNMEQGIIGVQDPETIAISFMAMVHGILSSMIIYRPENVTIHLETIWEIFWKGISEPDHA
ncbi:TetR/AcrR family transcriptional regulator [Dehalobacter sp. DCM]|uniref:TetR/AcrR family transcriptional regulator n=1 Tax=Dehalobacter sp. DCM TaxID=2907827 RepID=UPI003081353B|nr:TetR/AcrR family transcriptional regulator [Dehalobacter sp. DCM]